MRFLLLVGAFAGVCLAAAPLASAQYKYIEPNGKSVTYSDLPPPPNSKILKQGTLPASSSNAPALPYELQQAISKYPVLFYASAPCSSCDEARNFLMNRGIPFSERNVKTNDDVDALKRLSPDATVPLLLVGRNKSVGFSATAWGDLLDQAGYPAASKLPAGYQYAAAESAAPSKGNNVPAGGIQSSPGAADNPTPPRFPQSGEPASNAPPGFRF